MPKIITVDMTDVPDDGFAPLPKGEYTAIVDKLQYRVGKTSGQPFLNWQWKITGPTHANRVVFMTSSLQPQSLWVLKAALKALGLPHNGAIQIKLADDDETVLEPKALGKPARLSVGVSSDGKGNDVNEVLPIDGDAGEVPVVGKTISKAPSLKSPVTKKKLS